MPDSNQFGIEFNRLVLNNFASYLGEHSIDLSTDARRPVVIIMGGNGFGKSSIFHALNWGLYGTLYERDLARQKDRSIEDFIHEKEVAAALQDGRNAHMSVTAHFRIQSEKYYVTQQLSIPVRAGQEGTDRPAFGEPERSTRTVRIDRSGNHKELEFEGVLDQALPNNVRDYFLFDGDRIHELSEPGSSQEVRDALRRVVDLDLLAEAEKDVRDVARQFGREANALASGELKSVGEALAKARDDLASEKEALAKLKDEERLMRDKQQSIEKDLSETAEGKPLQEKRKYTEKRLQDLEGERTTIHNRVRELLPNAFLTLPAEKLTLLTQELGKRRDAGDLPAKINKTLLQELLENQTCLCGATLNDGSEGAAHIRARLEKLERQRNLDDLQPLFFQLVALSDDVGHAYSELNEQQRRLDENTEAAMETETALKEVEDRLKGMPDKDVASLENAYAKTRNDIDDNKIKQGASEQRMEDTQQRIDDLLERQARLMKDQEASQEVNKRERLADDAADALGSIYTRFAEDSRASVEELTRERFRGFLRSSSEYDVALTDDYALTVVDSSGTSALQRLSMGQRQCLSLAFITSVSEVSGKQPPLAIDMPFGRLDGDVDQNVASELSEITHQLILFLLPDREWTPGIQDALRGKVSHLHTLEFDPSTRSTSVQREGEF